MAGKKFFEWSPELALDVEAMDDQHEKLIGMMNRLSEQNDAGASRAELLEGLEQLARFTVEHFDAEEAYMQSIGYPKLERHKLIHGDLLKKLQEHVVKFRAGDGRISRELLGFLKLWLGAHIKGIDRQYAEHGRGLSRSA